MRLLLVGDTHRNVTFLTEVFQAARLEACDQIIQLGDFGFGWQWLSVGDGLEICRFSAVASVLVEQTGIPLSFLDGNHENFDRLANHQPQGDGTREVAPGVVHLPRGHRFELGGCSFLTLGGAVSLDKMARKEGVSWWSQESVTLDDVLACGSGPVDVLLTHDMPLESGFRPDRPISGYGVSADLAWYRNRLRLTEVLEATSPRWVFHGHLHHRYELDLRPARSTTIVGLASDRHPVERACVVFDTSTRQYSALSSKTVPA